MSLLGLVSSPVAVSYSLVGGWVSVKLGWERTIEESVRVGVEILSLNLYEPDFTLVGVNRHDLLFIIGVDFSNKVLWWKVLDDVVLNLHQAVLVVAQEIILS